MSKRKLEEWDISDMKEAGSANVHFIVTQVSPLKESRNNKIVKYLDSMVTDGKATARAVSFEPSL